MISLFFDGRSAVGADLFVLRVQKARTAGGALGVEFLFPQLGIFVEDERIAVALDAGKIALLKTLEDGCARPFQRGRVVRRSPVRCEDVLP